MPYANEADLPRSVREHLPLHAQHIFLSAFNHAWHESGSDEARAFRVAWAAVKRVYVKVGGEWVLPARSATGRPSDTRGPR